MSEVYPSPLILGHGNLTVMSRGETAHAPVLSVTAVCERQEGGKVWRETLLCWQGPQHGEGEAGQHMAAPDGSH